MKRIFLTSALVALMPVAVLSQAASNESSVEGTGMMMENDSASAPDGAMPSGDMMQSDGMSGEMMSNGPVQSGGAEGDQSFDQSPELSSGQNGLSPDSGSADAPSRDDTIVNTEMDPTLADRDMTAGMRNQPLDDGRPDPSTGHPAPMGISGTITAQDIVGSRFYVMRGGGETWDETAIYDAVSEDWERAGSVQDLVIDADGKVTGMVAEIGGFLGLGDKFVMLTLDEAKLIPLQDGNYDVVTFYSEEQLEDRDAYDAANLE
ncbi:PRC-barrel domain-containing protein [Sagittula sp. SSi028]|uniref:PRC-barrel domain-containing protein n=1 Tax=Sagittula sp. SSi028 TaxID=3400636 RepID=UPI003AF48E95